MHSNNGQKMHMRTWKRILSELFLGAFKLDRLCVIMQVYLVADPGLR